MKCAKAVSTRKTTHFIVFCLTKQLFKLHVSHHKNALMECNCGRCKGRGCWYPYSTVKKNWRWYPKPPALEKTRTALFPVIPLLSYAMLMVPLAYMLIELLRLSLTIITCCHICRALGCSLARHYLKLPLLRFWRCSCSIILGEL